MKNETHREFGKKNMLVILLIVAILMPSLPTLVSAEDQPLYGGTLNIATAGDPISFNILFHFWSTSLALDLNIYNKLRTMDENYKPKLELAESMDVSEDGKVWTFHLYDNIYWHDGVKFTSADVKWHYEQIKKGTSFTAPALQDLESIEVPDDYTVIFKFSKLNLGLAFGGISQACDQHILPKHIYEGTELETNPANWKPIGTGPFKVTEYLRDKYVIMEANENYFKGRPYLDKMIWTYYPSAVSALIALEAGEVDYVHVKRGVPFADIERLKNDPRFGAMAESYPTKWQMIFNFREESFAKYPFLEDKNVRKAISASIDRNLICEEVYYGAAIPEYAAISSQVSYYHNPDGYVPSYNLDYARNLLDEAGYPVGSDGFRFEFEMVTYNTASDAAEVMKQMLREAGIDLTLKIVDENTFDSLYFLSEEGLGDIPCGFQSMGGGNSDPDGISRYAAAYGASNMGFYNNSRVTELFLLGKSAWKPEERQEYYYEIQEILAEEVPFIPLWGKAKNSAWNVEYKGLDEIKTGIDYYKSLNGVWWTGGTLVEPEPPITEDLAPRIDNLESDILGIQGDISGIQGDISGIKGDISDLIEDIESISVGDTVAGVDYISYLAIAIAIISIVYVYITTSRK